MSISPKVTFKVVVIGDYAVGKTSLCKRFAKKAFTVEYKPTIGTDIMTRIISLPYIGKVSLQIWDTAGEEKFKKVVPIYFKGANYALLVFDLTRKQTYDALNEWYNMLLRSIGEIPVLIVGNKMDLEDERKVSKEDGLAIAKDLGAITYVETSAKNGWNVENIFRIPAEYIIKEIITEKGI